MATKAQISPEAAIQLANEIYGFESLPSYDDVNYRLDTKNGKFLLKVFHGEMSKNRIRLQEQLDFQYFLKQNGILVPSIIADKNGELQSYKPFTLASNDEGECAIRMLEYVEGNICQKLPLCDEFFAQIGQNCAKMHNLMATGSSRFPGLNSLRHDWTLESVVKDPAWRTKSSAIDTEKSRDIVGKVLADFENYVEKSGDLPSGIVHCDLNSLNIIGEELSNGKVDLKAIIDFGDVCHSLFMFDLAICLIYMMVAAKVQNGCMYKVVKQVLSGYQAERQLLTDEKAGLLLAVKARACQSVIGGYYTATLEPENREYLMSECSVAEKILHEVDEVRFNLCL